MSRVQDSVKCEQCGFTEAIFDFNCRDSSWIVNCQMCGYCEELTAPKDDAESWSHKVNHGFGALYYRSIGAKAFALHSLDSLESVGKAESWLREHMDAEHIEPESVYLTRWNEAEKRIDFLIGGPDRVLYHEAWKIKQQCPAAFFAGEDLQGDDASPR